MKWSGSEMMVTCKMLANESGDKRVHFVFILEVELVVFGDVFNLECKRKG
jgi:hypothetical protein